MRPRGLPVPVELSPAVRATLASLRVDLVTAEVLGALRDSSVRAILLKGPSIALWIYAPGDARPYRDSDLLVGPADRPAAESVLARLGFARILDDADTPDWQAAHCWRRARDGAHVDVHRGLIGIEADSEQLWEALSRRTETVVLAGAEVEVLAPAARALHLALHAAQHGARAAQPLSDLRRALHVLPRAVWRDAAALAERLHASSAFATGLRLAPAGAALAAGLGLPTRLSTRTALRATTPPPGAMAWEQFARTSGRRARVRFVARTLLPTPRRMRAGSPLARSGRPGLLAAYLWRPLRVLVRAGPAALAWRRAARRARASSRESASDS